MKIHTLGPRESDSNFAYNAICLKKKSIRSCQLKLHNTFSEIYSNLDEYKGDLFLVPVAYKGSKKSDNWTDNNFKYSNKLKIIYCCKLETKPMLLIENKTIKKMNAIIHPATEILLDSLSKNLMVDYADSKPEAFKRFCCGNYKYCIASEDVYNNFTSKPEFKILRRFTPEMIWCVYKIL